MELVLCILFLCGVFTAMSGVVSDGSQCIAVDVPILLNHQLPLVSAGYPRVIHSNLRHEPQSALYDLDRPCSPNLVELEVLEHFQSDKVYQAH
jgi:hypothetical protein